MNNYCCVVELILKWIILNLKEVNCFKFASTDNFDIYIQKNYWYIYFIYVKKDFEYDKIELNYCILQKNIHKIDKINNNRYTSLKSCYNYLTRLIGRYDNIEINGERI